ncbi:type III secretion protein U [Oxalobacteraceae bacterium GrIS 1.11]
MSDKNEKPTAKRIEDARKKGQIAMSRDLARICMLSVVSELALGTEPWWREAISTLFDLSIRQVGQPFEHGVGEMLGAAGTLLILVFGTFFVVCPVIAFLSHWGQFGILIAPEAITPSIDKINPANGVKNLFSSKKVGELLLAVFKAVMLGWLSYTLVRKELPSILLLAGGEPKDIYFGFIKLLRSVLHVVMGLCAVLALIDFSIQKYFHIKSLKMDMDEIKREYKESEGDPMVKATRKGLARQWASEGPVAKTQNANAVVVNPSHFAVAMFYDSSTPAPMVVAKGKDEVAQAMISMARQRGIPVIRHVWLARTLYATGKADHFIPKASYESVAHVYAVVEELRATKHSGPDIELESRGMPPASHQS